MRICILTFYYKPAGGGVPRYVENISRKFVEAGHKVDIITASYEPNKKIEQEGNLTIYKLPCMNLSKSDEINEEKTREFLEFLRDYTRRKNPDILSVQAFHSKPTAIGHTLAVNIVSMENEIPSILTIHSFIQKDEYETLKFMMVKNLLWKKIICVGSNLSEDLFSKGVSSKKIITIYPPVDMNQFKQGLGKKWLRSRVYISEKELILLAACRMESMKAAEEKGIPTLIKALSSIKDKKVHLLIGAAPCPPPFEDSKKETISRLKETAKILGVGERVIIKTFEPEEMPLVYNGADIFVLPSKMESFGLSYAEALSCGIPTIGTSVGGVPEVIEDGKTGYLCAPENHVELAKYIQTMIKNMNKSQKMGLLGRESIKEKCDLEKISKTLIGVYNSTINKGGKSLGFFERLSKE
jgi:glycosyltransferase involved in cell wall biosynthesis